jgi:hypothetical protein
MDGQATPIWLLSGGHEGLSGVPGGRAARPTDNPNWIWPNDTKKFQEKSRNSITPLGACTYSYIMLPLDLGTPGEGLSAKTP